MVLANCLHCGSVSAYRSDIVDTDPICPQCGGTVAILMYTEAEASNYFPELSAGDALEGVFASDLLKLWQRRERGVAAGKS